ncbi:hypothetical protein DER45DRAFT_544874 [Fusarium avenaceum]|nr:hypothetical protein DER45DRAFT_544874 [Fusarium avenaceum]
MCPTNDTTHVCSKPISQLMAPGTRHTWGPDCIRALQSHIFTHKITPSCPWKRFSSHLLPSLFLFQETYPDRDFWNKLVKKAKNLLRNKLKSLVDQGVIVWDEHAEKYVLADTTSTEKKIRLGRGGDQPSMPVTPSGSRWNEDVRVVAGGDGAIAINSNDARLTFHHTTNVYERRKTGRRFKDAFATDTESDLSCAIPRRLPSPSSSASASASTSDAETNQAPSTPFEHPPSTPPSPSPSWPAHRHRTFTSSISPSESISAVGARSTKTDIQPQLQHLEIKQLYAALDELGTRLVEQRVQMMRGSGNQEELQNARNTHLELLGNVCKELDRRVGVKGELERRLWWLED